MKYRLIGEVEIHKDFAQFDVIRHTEIVEAPEGASREELIEVSLSTFTEEEEPVWEQGYPLVLPEPQERSVIAGESDLRSAVLLEALIYIKAAQVDRFKCHSINYVTGVVTDTLSKNNVRVTVGEVERFLLDAGYPEHSL